MATNVNEYHLKDASQEALLTLLAKLGVIKLTSWKLSMAAMLLGNNPVVEVEDGDWLIVMPLDTKLVARYLVYTPRPKR